MQEQDLITIFLVDDHDLVRIGLKLSLQQVPEFRIVGDCVDGQSAIKQIMALRPKVVLMDIGLPGIDGIETTRQIKNALPESLVIMLTSHSNDADILASLGAGANGFCCKDVSVDQLIRAIQAVNGGETWLEDSIRDRVLRTFGNRPSRQTGSLKSKQSVLFDREVQLMRLVEQRFHITDPNTNGDSGNLPDSPVKAHCSHPVRKEDNTCNIADRYSLESVISEGGMGIVYKARHLDMDKVVAIKVLKDELVIDRRMVRWFQQEAKAASSLSHPNIISIFDFGVSESGQPFLVMDYVDGQTLDEVILNDGGLDLQRFVKVFLQVCDGLVTAHERNIIHCDIKPSNIMLVNSQSKDEVKIVDFGLAKTIPAISSVQTQLTDSFEIAGSPLYMSPEQCLGKKLDFRSDIYSLGCVMYAAITGQPVFITNSALETFGCHMREMPKHFFSVCPDRMIPSKLEEIIFTALNKDPDHRFQSVAELRTQLSNIAHVSPRYAAANLLSA